MEPQRALRVVGEAAEPAPLADHTRTELLTVDETAKRLRISRTLCYELIKRRAFPVVHFPGTRLVRVTARAVEAFIDGGGAIEEWR